MNTKVKICGITSLEDALAALDAGADFLGLIFAQSSPRRVEIDAAKEIIAGIAGRAQIVGVFKDQELEFVSELAVSLKLDYVQCHGKETVDYVRRLPMKVIKVLELEGVSESDFGAGVAAGAAEGSGVGIASSSTAGSEESSATSADVSLTVSEETVAPAAAATSTIGSLAQEWRDDAHFLLFDRPKLLSDPEWYKRAVQELLAAQPLPLPYFFAGGLSAENVGEVVAALHPFAVDVASSVEASAGKKDVAKMIDFCKAVKKDSGGVSACAH